MERPFNSEERVCALATSVVSAESNADDAYLVTAQRVLELARNAKALWNTRSPGIPLMFVA
jgi:hypothetical protein